MKESNHNVRLYGSSKNSDFTANERKMYSVRDTEHADAPELLTFKSIWKESKSLQSIKKELSGSFLIVSLHDNWIESFKQSQIDASLLDRMTFVTRGEAFKAVSGDHYHIEMTNREYVEQVIKLLCDQGSFPQHVIFVSDERDTFEQDPDAADLAVDLMSKCDQEITMVFHFVQSLLQKKARLPLNMMYTFMHHSGAESHKAAMSAFTKSIQQEYEQIRIKTIEFQDKDQSKQAMVRHMLFELQQDDLKQLEIRYSQDKRFFRDLKEIWREKQVEHSSFQKDGVYLITGGTGGIGYQLAEYLVKKYRAKLILMGRSPINKVAEKIQGLKKFQEHILYVQGDVSKQNDVLTCLNMAKNQFSEINGVFHCAGVIKDSFLYNKTVEEVRDVLAPKVKGALWLLEALQEKNLDMFVMFSSSAAISGNAGQSDYAYANSFLDHLAIRKPVQTKRFISINWPFWEQGGMSLTVEQAVSMKETYGMSPLPSELGFFLLEDAVRYEEQGQMIVFYGERKRIAARLREDLGRDNTAKQQITLDLQVENELARQTEAWLKEELGTILKHPVEELDNFTPLGHYGVDSIAVNQFNLRIGKKLSHVPKTILFEQQTIEELKQYLMAHYKQQLLDSFNLDKKLLSKPLSTVESSRDSKSNSNSNSNSNRTSGVHFKEEKDEVWQELSSITSEKRPSSSQNKKDRAYKQENEIAVIGLSGQYPQAANINEFWRNLMDGKDCITEIPEDRWKVADYFDPDPAQAWQGKMYSKWGGFLKDIDQFDPFAFNITPREAELMDPQERLFLETTWHALEDAGYSKRHLQKLKRSKARVGVFAAVTSYTYNLLGTEEWAKGNMVMPSSTPWTIANRVSYFFDLQGPSIPVDTACSSGLTALHLACESLKRGESHMAIAGGVNLYLHPSKYIGMCQMKMLSPSGHCHSFGAQADGFVPGEGIGVLILKPLAQAIEDHDHIYGIIKGTSVNHGGNTNGFTVPSLNAQADLIADCLEQAQVSPEEISYIEAHGTGTSLGDPIEIAGLSKAFENHTSKKQYCAVGSVKANIGHLEAAAGIAGVTKVLLQMKHKVLVPSIHAEQGNPNIDFSTTPFYVQKDVREWHPSYYDEDKQPSRPRYAGVSSFGAGGANAHVIIEEYTDVHKLNVQSNDSEGGSCLFVLSAHSKQALKDYSRKLVSYIDEQCTQVESLESELLLEDRVIEIVKSVSGIEQLTRNENLLDNGIDVLHYSAIADRINQTFHTHLSTAEIMYCHTVQNICELEQLSHLQTNQKERYFVVDDVVSLRDIAFTLQVGRDERPERLAVIANSYMDLKESLLHFCNDHSPTQKKAIYYGHIKEYRNIENLLLNSNEGDQLLEALLKDRNLEKIAQLWTAGVQIEWDKLYKEGNRPFRVSLPGYPFEKERYWIPQMEQVPQQKNSAFNIEQDWIHPLVHKNQSTIFENSYTTILTPDLFPGQKSFLCRKSILPGASILEMVRAAGEHAVQQQIQALTHIEWIKPVSLEDSISVSISLALSEHFEDQRTISWSVYAVQNNKRDIYAQGELLLETVPPAQQKIELIKEGQYVNQEKFYSTLTKCDMSSIDQHQIVQGLSYNETEGLASYELLHSYLASTDWDKQDLSLLMSETIVQSMVAFLIHTQRIAPAPYHLSNVKKAEFARNLPTKGFIHISYRDHIASIHVTDEAGQVCLTLTDVQLVEVLEESEESVQEVIHEEQISMFSKGWQEGSLREDHVAKQQGTLILLATEQTEHTAQRICQMNVYDQSVVVWARANDDHGHAKGQPFYLNLSNQKSGHTLAQKIFKEYRAIKGIIDLTDLQLSNSDETGEYMGKVGFVQELLAHRQQENFSLIHLTKNRQSFKNEQQVLNGAIFAGFVSMLGSEYAKVQSTTIDIDDALEQKQLLEHMVLSEVQSKQTFGTLCYRDGIKYEPVLNEIDKFLSNKRKMFSDVQAKESTFIVITGGTRGIGASIANELVDSGIKRIVIMGQQSIPPKEQWSEILLNPSYPVDLKQKLTHLQSLEEKGAEIERYDGSLTDDRELSYFFERVRRKWGKVRGVFHCAGLISKQNAAFIYKEDNDIQSVLEPKVQGLNMLHQIVKKDRPEFFLLFSSLSATAPALAAGLSDYAAANSYMNDFASYQKNKGYSYYKAINWPSWAEAGMGEVKSPIYTELGLASITNQIGFATLSYCMFEDQYNEIVPLSTRESLKLESLLQVKKTKKMTDSQPPGSAIKSSDEHSFKRAISEESMGKVDQEDTLLKLQELFSEELKIPLSKLDINQKFGEFGVDSILLAELVRKIENWLGEKLEPSIMLEYPTLQLLADQLRKLVTQNEATGLSTNDENTQKQQGRTLGRSRLILKGVHEKHISNQERKNEKRLLNRKIESSNDKVAIIGMACHFPLASNIAEYWDNLVRGVDCITEVPRSRWDSEKLYSAHYQKGKTYSKWGGFIEGIEYFDPVFFNIDPQEAPYIDPLMRQFLEISVQTIRHAGYEHRELSNQKVGVFVGSRSGSFATKIKHATRNSIIGVGQNFIGAHISHFFNFKGPNVVLDTACSSSLVSVHLACQSLLAGDCDLALAGGVDLLLDEKPYIILSESKALSPDGKCHTFDINANGFVPGEGCGAVLLKPLEKALLDGDQIYAVIDSTAVNNDGQTMGMTTPNPEAQSEVIQHALLKGNIDPDSITYIETHGTGTMIGDPIELKALSKVIGQGSTDKGYCGVGSVKTNIGHLASAAGIASLIKVALALHHKELPKTLHCQTPNPRFKFEDSPFYPVQETRKWMKRKNRERRAGISSFGFGGTNAHALVSELDSSLLSRYFPQRVPLPEEVFDRKYYWLGEAVVRNEALASSEHTRQVNHRKRLLEIAID